MSNSTFPDDLQAARRQLLAGSVGDAVQSLEHLERKAQAGHAQLQQIAELYLQCGQHHQAGRCYQRALELQPSNSDYTYNLAASKTALGQLEEAEKLFSHAIKLNPQDYGAWLNRSGLKKQTVDHNHVEQLKFVKSRLAEDDPGQVQVSYALAKELEDLENYEESFQFLQHGSHRRRLGMQYDVQDDEQAMSEIARQFSSERLADTGPGFDSERPIFILGLPRSGTTLIDRIISSHSRVASLGEHNTLALAVTHLAAPDGNIPGKLDLIRQSTQIDPRTLGQRYCDGIDGFGKPADRLIDKTPQNFLFLGLIHLAMPTAKIIHLRRHPMDVCYAIYKTLFRAGYPFSYSLQEVGRYYIAYNRLMNHWRSTIPGAFLEVHYEEIISSQKSETQRILNYLDLEWEDSCLDFHRHSGVAATASAAQVRQPIYSSSVGLWRKYARQLAPFANKLQEHGIDFDTPDQD